MELGPSCCIFHTYSSSSQYSRFWSPQIQFRLGLPLREKYISMGKAGSMIIRRRTEGGVVRRRRVDIFYVLCRSEETGGGIYVYGIIMNCFLCVTQATPFRKSMCGMLGWLID